jgi:hypothetical protein
MSVCVRFYGLAPSQVTEDVRTFYNSDQKLETSSDQEQKISDWDTNVWTHHKLPKTCMVQL